MPYQPNPFVNPNQRGVELPAGCKDLMDVLETEDSWNWRDEVGKLTDVRAHAARFVRLKASPKFLAVVHAGRHLVLQVAETKGTVNLELRVYSDEMALKRTLRRVFRKPALCRGTEELAFLTLPTPKAATKIATVLTDLLVDGYGMRADDALTFCAGWTGTGKAGDKGSDR